MTIKISVFIATSLDGFIARKDGAIDWLDRANAVVPAGEDCGYQKFMASVDVLVMGRKSFEKVLTFGDWPYGEKQVLVLSSGSVAIPPDLAQTVTASSETPTDLCRRLAADGARHLYIDGGITIQRFLNAGLVTDLIITVIPVLLGDGRPLFGPLAQDLHLRHIETHTYDFGFVQLHYQTTAA